MLYSNQTLSSENLRLLSCSGMHPPRDRSGLLCVVGYRRAIQANRRANKESKCNHLRFICRGEGVCLNGFSGMSRFDKRKIKNKAWIL
jgi:hypothetical protein